MKIEQSFRLSLKVYASIVLVASLTHGIWHWFLPTYIEMKGLTEIQENVLFILNWSVAVFLLFLSILSFWASYARTFTLDQLRMFSLCMIGFWMCRFALEFIFPVQIPFVIIPNPSMLFKIFILIGITILIFPVLMLQLKRKGEK
ncbi:MAG: hypothetical protein V1752_07260 [Candidatus Firestonebacteria bacterium]